MPTPAWHRIAAYVICRDDGGRLLLTRFSLPGHLDHGRWTMPGGGMEWGERPEETAARELSEETGLSADIGGIVGVYTRWFTAEESVRGEAGHLLGVVFEATNVRGDLLEEFSDTTDAAGWFTLDQARALERVELVDFCLGLC